MTMELYRTYCFGDDTFGLCPTMMKPYSHRCMSREEKIFKYRFSTARGVVEILWHLATASRFFSTLNSIVPSPLGLKVDVKALRATITLHTTGCIHEFMNIRKRKSFVLNTYQGTAFYLPVPAFFFFVSQSVIRLCRR